jgi:predicted cupin superfamily sugar epimerase
MRIGKEDAGEPWNPSECRGEQRPARPRVPSHLQLRRRDLPQPLEDTGQRLPQAYEGDRPFGSALYFLVTPGAQIVLHRIRSDQLYHHYLGASLEVLLLYPDGTGEVVTVGSDLGAGQRPQLFLPGGTFHTSRLAPDADYALLASTEWPGVEPPDVEHGDADALVRAYPDLRDEIRAFTADR